MEKIIREVVKKVLSEYQSGDFCGCFEGDIDGVYPITIEALENKLVSEIMARLTLIRHYLYS